jgi:hypothetical protein
MCIWHHSYVYDRGYVGCFKDGTCDPEKEDALRTFEVVGDIFYFGMPTGNIGEWLNSCQEGHLEIYFDHDSRLIGARQLPTDRDSFCWNSRRENCSQYYNYRQPSSVSKDLVIDIDPEDIPEKICDQFEQ